MRLMMTVIGLGLVWAMQQMQALERKADKELRRIEADIAWLDSR